MQILNRSSSVVSFLHPNLHQGARECADDMLVLKTFQRVQMIFIPYILHLPEDELQWQRMDLSAAI